jgi:hypothetical protein
MKIKLSQLRRIIRETIEEQSVVPGKLSATSEDPITDDDVALMGSGGLGGCDDDDDI